MCFILTIYTNIDYTFTPVQFCPLATVTECNSYENEVSRLQGLPHFLCSNGWNMRTCTLCPPCCLYFYGQCCCFGYIRKVVVLSMRVHSADCTTHHHCISHLLKCNARKRGRTVDKTHVAPFLYFDLYFPIHCFMGITRGFVCVCLCETGGGGGGFVMGCCSEMLLF